MEQIIERPAVEITEIEKGVCYALYKKGMTSEDLYLIQKLNKLFELAQKKQVRVTVSESKQLQLNFEKNEKSAENERK